MKRSSIAAAESLSDALPAALEAAVTPYAQARAFLDGLVTAMRAARLARNPDAPATIEPRAEWQSIFAADGRWRHDPLLAPLRELGPL